MPEPLSVRRIRTLSDWIRDASLEDVGQLRDEIHQEADSLRVSEQVMDLLFDAKKRGLLEPRSRNPRDRLDRKTDPRAVKSNTLDVLERADSYLSPTEITQRLASEQ